MDGKATPAMGTNGVNNDDEPTTDVPEEARQPGDRSAILDHFPPYYNSPTKTPTLAETLHAAVTEWTKLRAGDTNGPVPLASDFRAPDYMATTSATLPQTGHALSDVITDVVQMFSGMNNSSHPLHQVNVIPQANTAAIVAASLSAASHQTYLEGEKAWNTARAELETAAMITSLIPKWDTGTAGGFFTFGGTGCTCYAIKYALARVLPASCRTRARGVRTEVVLLCSQQAHYALSTAADWLGIGTDAIQIVRTLPDTHEMDMCDLEHRVRETHAAGVPILAVVCTMGTTDTFAIDDTAETVRILDKYPNAAPYGRAHVYCDAVIGWVLLTFAQYDFDANVLNIAPEACRKIRRALTRMQGISHADSVALDFHKTGWATYTSSMFLARDFRAFKSGLRRPGSPYLQYRVPYSPCLYTLETTRSSAPALAAWASLRYFGASGYHTLVAGGLEVAYAFRARLKAEPDMACCNAENDGFVSLFRMYRPGTDGNKQYAREMYAEDAEVAQEVLETNQLQRDMANMMWAWLRSGRQIDGIYAPYTGMTHRFRNTVGSEKAAAAATTEGNSGDATKLVPLNALKTHPLNSNVTMETMEHVLKAFKIARKMVLAGEVIAPPDVPLPMPYEDEI